VYDHPPPDGSGIHSLPLDDLGRGNLRGLKLTTRVRDWLQSAGGLIQFP
jgi:hypothetical protein